MKKRCIIFWMIAVILCAGCGKTEPADNVVVRQETEEAVVTEAETTAPTKDPNAGKQARYDAAMEALQSYLETGSCVKSGSGAVVFHETAAKYIQSEFLALNDYLDSQEIASRFGPHVNRLAEIKVRTKNNLGSASMGTLCTYEYDSKGRLLVTDAPDIGEHYGYDTSVFGYLHLEYDSNDVLKRITVMDAFSTVLARIIPTFDEKGLLLKTDVTTNVDSYTCEFSYDVEGNRISGQLYDPFYNEIHNVSYQYDMNNRLVQRYWKDSVWNMVIITDYVYDETGRIISATESKGRESNPTSEYVLSRTYQYNEAGELSSFKVIPDSGDTNYASMEFLYKYEQIFGYRK